MLGRSSTLNSRYTYNVIFNDICKTRFNHLVTRLFLTTNIFQTFIVILLSKGQYSIVECILMFISKFILLFVVALVVIITRKNYMHVRSLCYSTLTTQIIGQLFSFTFIVYQIIFSVCSFLLALAYGDCFGISSIDSQYTPFYRAYVWLLIPTVYALQHHLFDLDKLSFSFELQHQLPQQQISSKFPKHVAKALVLTAGLTIISPIIFGILTSTYFIGFGNQIKLVLLAFCIFVNLEFINLAFNAHMTIGCLHKGKPLSSLSPTPIETLITGLRSDKSFTKLTAFQELSYRATSSDLSLRLPIYNNTYRTVNLWPNILKECLLVIEETNEIVGKYLQNLESNMNVNDTVNSQFIQKFGMKKNTEELGLFGNDPITVTNSISSGIPGTPPPPQFNNPAINNNKHRISLRDDNILLHRNAYKNKNAEREKMTIPNYLNSDGSYNNSVITHDTKLIIVIKNMMRSLQASINSFFFPSTANERDQMNQLSLLEAWYLSKQRQAEKLVPLPICHAESVVALMGLLINAIDESPKGSVVVSVGEVLKYLERSIGVLGRFTDWNPKSPSNTIENHDTNKPLDVISIIYELSTSAFLEIVLRYNVLLNDVYLDDDVVKLSKWVLDICASQ